MTGITFDPKAQVEVKPIHIQINDLMGIAVIGNEIAKLDTNEKIEDIVIDNDTVIKLINAHGYSVGSLVMEDGLWVYNPIGYGEAVEE